MAVRELNELEAREFATNYVLCKDKHETYRIFNPNWGDLKHSTLITNTSEVFGQPLVKLMITDIQGASVQKLIERYDVSLQDLILFHLDCAADARTHKQFGVVHNCGKEIAKLLNHYNKVRDDALTVDMVVSRPAHELPKP